MLLKPTSVSRLSFGALDIDDLRRKVKDALDKGKLGVEVAKSENKRKSLIVNEVPFNPVPELSGPGGKDVFELTGILSQTNPIAAGTLAFVDAKRICQDLDIIGEKP